MCQNLAKLHRVGKEIDSQVVYRCMTISMYCLYVGFDYTYIDITHWHRGLNPFWLHKFGFKPLLRLEPMAPICPQLLVSHANHSATETSLYTFF